MPEKNLNCFATNCAQNYNQQCNAGTIHIRGNSAIRTSETTCSTYFADSVGSFTRAIDVGGPTGTDNIISAASNCIYSQNTRPNP